jgi:hypothetical protein
MQMQKRARVKTQLIAGVVASLALTATAGAQTPLADAQQAFYNGRYDETALLLREACSSQPMDLAACELRTSALLFQMKQLLGAARDRERAWKSCSACPALMTAFLADIGQGQKAARAALSAGPDDETLFLLGKLDLNYVWLQLGTLGRKTGWSEYWEARKSLDTVLKKNPQHVRARVARAWIDYIVDTRMPRGTRWLLGGGNKKKGFLAVQEAASAEAEMYVRAEARFALWDMQVRERQLAEAVDSARQLSREFPDNQELRRFLETHAR